MNPTTVKLVGEGVAPSLVGGKGAALDRLIGLGVRVPPTGVVTVHAYRRFAAQPELARFLGEVAARPIPPPDRIRAEHDEITDAFLAHELPNELLAEVEGLAAVVGRRFRLAVRSSATAEDQVDSSFAGQYDSYLCVDRESLSRSIRLIWASLWFPRVRAYRRARGIPDDELAMAVVVMRMVAARHAGVVFTVDPGGSSDSLRIEVVEGLAEDLVSGSATPEVVLVPRTGGIEHPGPLSSVFTELTAAALDIETRLGRPQDIEWAHDGRRLFIVQARPITTLAPTGLPRDEFDSDPAPDTTYTSAGVGEMLPGVLPPLLWSMNGPILEDAFRVMGDDMGQIPDGLERQDSMIGRFRGRAALNLTLLRRIADKISGGAAEEIEKQYFGMVVSEEEGPRRTSGGIKALLPVLRAAGLRRRLRHEAPLLIAAVDEVVAADVPLADLDPARLLAYRHRVRELAARVVAAESEVAATAAASFRGLELFLERYIADEAAEWAQRLTAGTIAAAGTLAAVDLTEIMAALDRHPNLGELLHDREPERSDVEAQAGGDDMLAAFDRALDRSGSQAVYGGPTWAENDRAAWQLVCRNFLAGGRSRVDEAGDALRSLEKRLTASRKWRLTRILTGQVVDMRLRLLRGLVRDTTDFLGLRETTKRALLRLGGEERRISLHMATALVRRGALPAAEDVVYLSDQELESAFRGGPLPAGLVARRRAHHERAEAIGPLPLRFEGYPEPVRLEVVATDTLEGWGASPGRHTGVPRVVRSLEAAAVEPGDVLVARSTDPSWTPLFLIAGAIVVEEGGPLSHAAIVARELGLPAVLHIAGAVEALDGVESVTVDGTAGRIFIHSEDTEPDRAVEAAA